MTQLFFDVETLPLPAAVAQLPEPVPPANYKDEAKIAAWVAAKRAEQVREAALDPDTGAVALIGFASRVQGPITVAAALPWDEVQSWDATRDVLRDEDRDLPSGAWRLTRLDLPTLQYGELLFHPMVFAYQTEADALYAERNLLDFWWLQWAEHDGEVCGYNLLNFDLPFVMRRTLYTHATRQPPIPQLRYNSRLTDLYALLYGYKPGGKGLKTITKLLGIANPFTAAYGAEVDGDASLQLPLFERLAYCAADVWLTQQLAQRMDGLYMHLEDVQLTADEFPF